MQLELLKLLSRDLEEKDVIEIKQLIVNYLAEKLESQTNKIWEAKNLSNEDMEHLLNTHLDSPK
jgi:predicted kinase